METIRVRQGADTARTVQLRDASGDPITTYAGTEPLALALWPGSARAPLTQTTSGVAWLSHAAGTLTLTLTRADTATWEAGFYDAVVTITDGSSQYDCWTGVLEVQAQAATEAAPATYCTLDDVRRECPWIMDAVLADPSIPNNLETSRSKAYEWTVAALHRHWRGGYSLGAEGGMLARRRSGQRNMWLQSQIEAGAVILSPALVRANACHALGDALDHLIGQRGATSYQELAARYYATADELLSQCSVELDTNADGTPDFCIDLGFIDVLRG